MLGAGNLNLTPTQIASHERSKAFKAKIAEMAARLTDDMTIAVLETVVEPVEKSEPPRPKISELWFSMVPPAGEPLPVNDMPSVRKIQNAICRYYNIRRSDLVSARRPSSLSLPRQVACFICKDLTRASLPQIGRHFGGRDHTTILHAVRKIDRLLAKDNSIAFDVAAITCSLIGDRPQ